jgi:hypothetical protein
MCICHRRLVTLGLLSLPFALAGCGKPGEGPEEIKYAREACTRCGMIISDPHFATEIRGGANNSLAKFDDMGCAILWLREQAWPEAQLKEFWVMDNDTGMEWLEARRAFFFAGAMSPMNYGYGAVKAARADTVDFTVMQKDLLARFQSNYCDPADHGQPA